MVNGEKKNMDVSRRLITVAASLAGMSLLVVPSEVTALSNMPVVEERIDGDVKTVCYE